MKEKNTRLKYLKIIEILKQESDIDRPLRTNDLLNKLHERGVHIDRKILHEDIEVLIDAGYEIICERKKQNEYYIMDRQFDVPELRVLMDAVQSATFISDTKTEELLPKIANLGGSYRNRLMLKSNNYFNTNKHSNPYIYYSINEIEEAIYSNKKISFKYFDLNYKAERVYRKDGKKYTVNPVATVFSNEKYYLVCTSDNHDGYANYRIDRMEDCQVSTEDRTKEEDTLKFDSSNYRKSLFGMFNGTVEDVELEFNGSLIGVILDKFGEHTTIVPTGDLYRATLKLSVSKQFYGFISGLADKIEIKAPKWVVEDYHKYLLEILSKYNEPLYKAVEKALFSLLTQVNK